MSSIEGNVLRSIPADRLCNKCLNIKPIECFEITKTGIRRVCKGCVEISRKARFDKRKESGICSQCEEPRSGTSLLCESHRTRTAERLVQMKRDRRRAGLCVDCGERAIDGVRYCEQHRARSSAWRRARAIASLGRGICSRCAKRPLVTGSLCESCWWKGLTRSHGLPVRRVLELQELLHSQSFRCALTGDILRIGENISLDHVMPSSVGGSDETSNLRFVTLAANRAKSNLTDDELLELCKKIVKLRGV